MLLELAMIAAMQDSTTTCRNLLGGTVQCQTQQNNTPWDAYNAARESQMRTQQPQPQAPRDTAQCARGDWFLIGCTISQHDEAEQLVVRQRRAVAARDRAMSLLRDGDCAGAVRSALDTGDLQFATEVRTFCAAAPAAPQ